MDEEIKNGQATDDRKFVDALSDDNGAGAAPAQDQGAAQDQQSAAPAQKPDPLPPVNNQQPSPLPPVNNQQSSPLPPVNNQQSSPLPPINNQQANPMPPINNQQANPMPPVNNQPANQGPMGTPMGQPVNQGPMGTPMGQPMNQGPMGSPMGQPVNQGPMGSPMQQPNPLFSGPPQQEPKKKKKGGGGIIIVLVIVLVLLLGAGIAVLFATGILGPKKEIQLSKTSVKIDKGEEIVITVDNFEDDLSGVYLEYESADPKIAKISEEYDDAFVIQGKKKGKTTVTVSGKGCETITINVTVKD